MRSSETPAAPAAPMTVDILFAISCALAGLLCGWIAYPALSGIDPDAAGSCAVDHPPEEEPERVVAEEIVQQQIERERLNQIAQRLQSLSNIVASNVDAHQVEVQSVSEVIRAMERQPEPKLMLEAMNRLLDASELLHNQLCETQDKLQEQTSLLQSAEQEAMTDALTQIPNRRALDWQIEACWQASGSFPSTLMLLDIDHFKRFNDSYGHRAGDEVLRRVAKHIQYHSQAYGQAARFGGEEFAVIFPRMTLEQCQEIGEALRARIAQREFVFEEQVLRVTSSMGIAQLQIGESPEQWLERADQALYASKTHGRNVGHASVGKELKLLTSANAVADTNGESTDKEDSDLEMEGFDLVEPELGELPRSLQGLPIGRQLLTQFSHWAGALRVNHTHFVTAAIRIDDQSANLDQLKELVRTVRSVVRSVDRIGILDARTLVVGMPNIDGASAIARADRIRCCLNDPTSPMLATTEPSSVSVALSSTRGELAFSQMLRQTLDLLRQAEDEQKPDQTLTSWNAALG